MKSSGKIVSCLLLGLVALYVDCYLSLVQRHVASGFTLDGHHGLFFTYPGYRGGGKGAETLFAPAYWLDQRIRARYWADMTESDVVAVNPDASGIP